MAVPTSRADHAASRGRECDRKVRQRHGQGDAGHGEHLVSVVSKVVQKDKLYHLEVYDKEKLAVIERNKAIKDLLRDPLSEQAVPRAPSDDAFYSHLGMD